MKYGRFDESGNCVIYDSFRQHDKDYAELTDEGYKKIVEPIPRCPIQFWDYVDGRDEITVTTIRYLEFVKMAKIAEINSLCETSVIGGFESEITGDTVRYGTGITDRANWAELLDWVKDAAAGNADVISRFARMGFPPGMVMIKGDGRCEYKAINYSDYIAFCADMSAYKMTCLAKAAGLKNQVDAAETVDEVNAVVWEANI
jgi:hypothetical protein